MNAMTELKNLYLPAFAIKPLNTYRQIELEYDPEIKALWTFMKPSGTPCFNMGLINDIRNTDRLLETNHGQIDVDGTLCPVNFHILGSHIPNVFNYGGDLALFVLLIKSRDREALLHYARLCIDSLYNRLTSFNTNITVISLIQGDALGGGFEVALASHVLIAEENARMGFPEILFNLFPGMGAYSMLSRRIGAKKAEELILSGKIYSAKEMFDLGLIDMIVPAGEGVATVNDYMRQVSRRLNGTRALYECRRHTQPISHEEMMGITEVWVDAALRLQDRDLKMMARIVRSQLRVQEARRNGLPIIEEELALTID